MKVVHHPDQSRHQPDHFLSSGKPMPNPEVPGRIDALSDGVKKLGLETEIPGDTGIGPIARVHSSEYLAFLKNIYRRWQYIDFASAEVIPNIHPSGRSDSYPRSAVGQAGYHMADTSCPISEHTWLSAYWSAQSAVCAADQVINQDERAVYALCRPPGHHAFTDLAGGFCFLNNAAIAAQRCRDAGLRPAILDVDLHHGNGTQGIFYRRADVLTVSIHADPIRFYPFFWGHAHERGEGAGLGSNLNLPIARESGDDAFLAALDSAVSRIGDFGADVLVIALGLDAYSGDPFGGLNVSTAGFADIARRSAAIELPTIIIQEGGYLCPELGTNLATFLDSFIKHQ